MIFEGKLTLTLDDGREVSELVVSREHAADVVNAWAGGCCGSMYTDGSGEMRWCGGELGHEGPHAHDTGHWQEAR